MGTILQTISLRDNMSPTLDKINNRLEQTRRGMQKANESINAFGVSGGIALEKLISKTGQLIASIPEIGDEYTMLQSRMNLLVDSTEQLAELNDSIYASAIRARTPYQDLANVVTSLGTNASGAFGGDMSQIVGFSELLTKSFAVAGADATTIASTMYNLTQSLSSGKLLGQDYRILKQNAPMMIKYLQQYFDTNASGLDEMVEKGQVTAEAIKNAMFTASDDINDKFNSMDMTFGQAMTNMKNKLYYAFVPILSEVSTAIGSFLTFVSEHLDILLPTLVMIGTILIGTILLGLYAMIQPILIAVGGWLIMNAPIIMVIATIGALLGMLVGVSESIGDIVGQVFVFGAELLNFFKSIGNAVIDIINLMISGLNKLPGVSIQALEHFQMSDTVKAYDLGNEVGSKIGDRITSFKNSLGSFGDISASGFDIGSLGDISANTLDTANATKKMNKNGVKVQDDVKIDDESLKLLMDVATKKFTINYKQLTPTINATFGDIRETANVDDILGAIEEKTLKMMNSSLAY